MKLKIEYTEVELTVSDMPSWKWIFCWAFPRVRPVRLAAETWLHEQAVEQGENVGSPRLSDVKFPKWRTAVFLFGGPR